VLLSLLYAVSPMTVGRSGDGAWPQGGTVLLAHATLRISRQLPRSGKCCQGQMPTFPGWRGPTGRGERCRCWRRFWLTGRARHVRLPGKWRRSTPWHITGVERSRLGQRMTSVSRPLGTRWEKQGEGHERCHTEGGAPAQLDGSSPVVRNRSRRPRTATSPLVCGRVVTALGRVDRRTPPSTKEHERGMPLRPSLAQN
jgi:hypothetical protein